MAVLCSLSHNLLTSASNATTTHLNLMQSCRHVSSRRHNHSFPGVRAPPSRCQEEASCDSHNTFNTHGLRFRFLHDHNTSEADVVLSIMDFPDAAYLPCTGSSTTGNDSEIIRWAINATATHLNVMQSVENGSFRFTRAVCKSILCSRALRWDGLEIRWMFSAPNAQFARSLPTRPRLIDVM